MSWPQELGDAHVQCPICKGATEWKENSYRPFCSERCKLIDLDHWLSERYRISAADDTPAEDEAAPSMTGAGPEETIV